MKIEGKKLYIDTQRGLIADALEGLAKIVENQNTTDKGEPGEYVSLNDNGIEYYYTIDNDYDVILTDIRY